MSAMPQIHSIIEQLVKLLLCGGKRRRSYVFIAL